MQEVMKRKIPGRSRIKIPGLLGEATPTPVGLTPTGFAGAPEEQVRPMRQIPFQVGNPRVVTRRLDQPAGERPQEAVRPCARFRVSRELIWEILLRKPHIDDGGNFLKRPRLHVYLAIYFPLGMERTQIPDSNHN